MINSRAGEGVVDDTSSIFIEHFIFSCLHLASSVIARLSR